MFHPLHRSGHKRRPSGAEKPASMAAVWRAVQAGLVLWRCGARARRRAHAVASVHKDVEQEERESEQEDNQDDLDDGIVEYLPLEAR